MSIDFWKKEMMRLTDNREVLNTNRVLKNQDKGTEQISSSGIGVIYNATGKFLGRIGTSELVRVINTNTSITDNGYNGIIRTTHSAWKNNKPKTYNYQGSIILENSRVLPQLRNKELNVRAFLYLLRMAEGHGTLNPYNIIFGGSTFEPEQREGDVSSVLYHPQKMVTQWGYTSDAAGAYGWLSRYWLPMKAQLGFPNFEGQYQDAATVEVFRSDGLLNDIGSGEDSKLYTAMLALNRRWPSLPKGGQQGINKEEAFVFLQEGRVLEWNNNSALASSQGFLDVGR
jgi:muramidase (phage lysozyme)